MTTETIRYIEVCVICKRYRDGDRWRETTVTEEYKPLDIYCPDCVGGAIDNLMEIFNRRFMEKAKNDGGDGG